MAIIPTVRTKQDAPHWVQHAVIFERLDVRPLIARGEEPLSMITGAAARIPKGKVLSLRSPFDPVPLHNVLATLGFEAYTSGAGTDWTTLFLRIQE